MKQVSWLVTLIVTVLITGCQGGTSGVRSDRTSSGDNAEGIHIKEGPDTIAEVNMKLGVAYMQKGNYEVALLKMRRALAMDPKLPSAHYAIALLYEKLNQVHLAEKHYKEAISIDPLYAEAQNAYAVYLCKRERYSDADLHFNQALKNPLYKTPQMVYANAGFCAYQSKQYESAEAYLRKTLQIQPRNSLALYHMAMLSFESKKNLRARAYLQRFHDAVKPSPQSLLLGIKLEKELNDKDAVASYSMLLEKQFPDSDEAHHIRN